MPFHGGMRTGEQAGMDVVSWVVAADRLNAHARAARRVRWHDQHAKSARLAIVLSLFLALLAAALLVSGPAVIGPLLHSAAMARGTNRVGAIVYTMPDGIFCRHLAFDNATARLTEGPVEKCGNDLGTPRTGPLTGFAWGR